MNYPTLQGFQWTYFVLILCAFCLYSSWRHVFRQYNDMARERPQPASIDELAEQINQSATSGTGSGAATSESPPNDLPPKYEELGAAAVDGATSFVDDLPPPIYADAVAAAASAAETETSVPDGAAALPQAASSSRQQ